MSSAALHMSWSSFHVHIWGEVEKAKRMVGPYWW